MTKNRQRARKFKDSQDTRSKSRTTQNVFECARSLSSTAIKNQREQDHHRQHRAHRNQEQESKQYPSATVLTAHSPIHAPSSDRGCAGEEGKVWKRLDGGQRVLWRQHRSADPGLRDRCFREPPVSLLLRGISRKGFRMSTLGVLFDELRESISLCCVEKVSRVGIDRDCVTSVELNHLFRPPRTASHTCNNRWPSAVWANSLRVR